MWSERWQSQHLSSWRVDSFGDEPTVIAVNGVKIGGRQLPVIAGPLCCRKYRTDRNNRTTRSTSGCQFSSEAVLLNREQGPYSFQGYGEKALKMLKDAKDATGLGIVTEVMTPHEVELVGEYTDMFQLGTRNMTNFYLLREVGQAQKPVILKRGMSATIEEWVTRR